MSVTRELERLVIRLMGDASHYNKTLTKAIDDTEKFARMQEDVNRKVQRLNSQTTKTIANMEQNRNAKLRAIRDDHNKKMAQLQDPNRIAKEKQAYAEKEFDIIRRHGIRMQNMQDAHKIRLNRTVNPQTHQRMIDDHNQRIIAATKRRDLALQELADAHNKRLAVLNDPNRLQKQWDQSNAKMIAVKEAHDRKVLQLQDQANRRAGKIRADHSVRMQRMTDDALRREKEAIAKAAAEQLDQVMSSAKQIGMGLSIASVAIGAYSLKKFAEFDKGLIESIAVFGNISKETENNLEAKVLSVSQATIHSAKELATTYYEFASSGRSAEETMNSLMIVSRFATAGAFDLKTASNLLLRAQNALGLVSTNADPGKRAAESAGQMNRLANALVAGSNISQATVEELAQSLTNHFGASLRVVNKSLEEGIALLTVYSKEQQGLIAGSTGSRMIRLLGTPANTAAAAQRRKELGFNVFDETGKMKHFADIVKNLEDILGGMSEELKLATLEELGFEARIQHAILPLIGFSKQIRDNHNAILENKNVMEQMADKQMESFSNQMQNLKNKVDVVAIALGKSLVPAIKSVASEIEVLTRWWAELGITMTRNTEGGWTVQTNGLRNFAASLVEVGALAIPIYLVVRALSALYTASLAAGMAVRGAKLGQTLLGWKVPLAVAAAGILVLVKELGKLQNASKGIEGISFDEATDQNKRANRDMAVTTDKTRNRALMALNDIRDLDERKEAALRQQKLLEQHYADRQRQVDELSEKVKKGEPALPSIGGWQPQLSTKLIPGWGLVETIINESNKNNPNAKKLGASEDVAQWKQDKETLEDLVKRMEATKNALGNVGIEIANIDQLIKNAEEGAKQQVNEVGAAVDRFTRDLDRETKTLGMSTDEQKLWNLEQDAAYFASIRAGMGIGELVRITTIFAKIDLARGVIAYNAAAVKASKTTADFADELDKLHESSKEFWATFGMTDEQKEIGKDIFKLEQLAKAANEAKQDLISKSSGFTKLALMAQPDVGVNPLDKMLLQVQANAAKGFKHHEELMNRGKELTKDMLDPTQKLGVLVGEMNELLQVGAIGWWTYLKSIDEAADGIKTLENNHKSLASAIQQTSVGSAEDITRINAYLDSINGKGQRDPRNFLNAPPIKKERWGGLFPQNQLPAPIQPPGGWGKGGEPEGGWPFMNQFKPKAFRVGPQFDVGKAGGEEQSPIHKVLVDIKTILAKTDKDRPVVEIETADI